MDQLIICLLIILLIWEFLTWRRFTKMWHDLIQLRGAIARYIHRRMELLEELKKYAEAHQMPGDFSRQQAIRIPADGLTFPELQKTVYKNKSIHDAVHDLVYMPRWQAEIRGHKDLFYCVDEFEELQDVILKCVDAYNLTYDKLNSRIVAAPTSIVAKILCI